MTKGTTIEGSVAAGNRRVSLVARDGNLLHAGFVGVIGNPADGKSPSAAFFRDFVVDAANTTPRIDEVLYRFAGAIVPDGEGYKARVTARTIVPTSISFEYADNENLERARRVGPLARAHAWGACMLGSMV